MTYSPKVTDNPVPPTARGPLPLLSRISRLNYSRGHTAWHCRVGHDGLPDLLRAEYWAEAATVLASGDTIMCSGFSVGALLYVFDAGASGEVRVAVIAKAEDWP